MCMKQPTRSICFGSCLNPLYMFRKQPKSFTYDHCFNSCDPGSYGWAGQEDIFNCLGKDILDNAFKVKPVYA